ncbi:MAG: hypothetical protein MOB07_24430 [Acidobacteria bacterium]|nr:hypothetical protein [Acidobacteriota bacterium]
MKHYPEPRIQIAALPRFGDLHKAAHAEGVGLFSALLVSEESAVERRYSMD